MIAFIFLFNATATTDIYTLSLHDALPICVRIDEAEGERIVVVVVSLDLVVVSQAEVDRVARRGVDHRGVVGRRGVLQDRKSTRLNSSHANISYAVFCLKKKNRIIHTMYCK